MTQFSLGNFLLGLVGAAPASSSVPTSTPLEAVSDSAGNLWVVKQGTPVPYGVKSTSLGTYSSISSQGATALDNLLKPLGATAAQLQQVGNALDVGILQDNGLLVAVTPAGSENQPGGATPIAGATPTQSGGDAQGAGVTAGSVGTPSLSSVFGVFATLGFWKGIGLVLAGVLIIFFGALELRRLA